MHWIKWLVGGAIGGAIGVAIWGAIGYFTGYEVGWIAWGVGALAGLGVRAAAGETDGFPPGVTAVVTAVGAILLAKFLVVSLLVNDMAGEISNFHVVDPNTMVAACADEVVDEYEAAGRPVNWPPGHDAEEVPLDKSYPAEIWAEGQRRWNRLSPDQQREKTAAMEQIVVANVESFQGLVRDAAFRDSFSPFDLLWFGLAAITAFKLGSGMASDE